MHLDAVLLKAFKMHKDTFGVGKDLDLLLDGERVGGRERARERERERESERERGSRGKRKKGHRE